MRKSLKKSAFMLLALPLIIIIYCAILVGVCLFFRANTHTIDSSVREQNIVYVPESAAKEVHHDWFSFLDDRECYIVKPNEQEITLLLQDIENGSWRVMNEFHELVLYNVCGIFDDGKVVTEICDGGEKYICMYDSFRDEYVTDYNGTDIYSTVHWEIFVYDTENNLYYYFYIAE